NVDCIGCHYNEKVIKNEQEFKGHIIAASKKACVKCHGPSFDGVWEESKKELREHLAQFDNKLKQTALAIETSTLSSKEKTALKEKLEKAERWQRFVTLSKGEHNIYLAATTLRKEEETLKEIEKTLGVPLPDLSSLSLVSGGFCATMCHSKVGVKVPPETVTTSGKTMPHRMHTEMMSCNTCHEIGAHKSVPLREGVKESLCQGCHSL
ncbi:MAG: hypothetical protein Q7S00_02800, partial [bacterium]|nr:hypothetical protein [bacterium]